MDVAEVTQKMKDAEQRYYDMHRLAKTAASRLAAARAGASQEDEVGARACLQEAETAKRELLREIELLEDSLLD